MKQTIIFIGIVLVFVFGMWIEIDAQAAEKGDRKTITSPNGEVIQDLNGEWDSFTEPYGEWGKFGSYRNIFKITRKGNSLVGIKMRDDKYYPRGRESITGGLDKNGFKYNEILTRSGPHICKGQISEGGNKIISLDSVP
jgi:hypothetical protein